MTALRQPTEHCRAHVLLLLLQSTAEHCKALQSTDVAFAAAFLPLLNDSCGEGYTITINFVITIIVSYVFTIKIFQCQDS